MAAPAIVWFRNDLRLADNPALTAAVGGGRPVVPVYALDDGAAGAWRLGGASRWWLHHALAALGESLARRGSALMLRRGDSLRELLDIAAATGASAVFWNRRYEPWAIAQDRRVKAELRARGVDARSFNGSLCHEPWEVTPAPARPPTRFSFFAGLWLERGPPPRPLPVPALTPATVVAGSLGLDELELLPRGPDWAAGLRACWCPGEAGAEAALRAFLAGPVREYRDARHLPGRDHATSRLSPHLRFGEVSPRQGWHAAEATGAPVARDRMPAFQRELVWREFAYHLLYFFPGPPERPLRAGLPDLPWSDDEAAFRAWCQGRTGYPLVDAGMRELWRTGYMHNRARMVAASFLTKDLLVPWQRGAVWFWDTLCDADLANNTLGWQWVAGCGTDDAARRPPRILNPVAHGGRFDPDGAYVRRWVPELARLPDAFLHRPFAAPRAALAYAGVRLGETYPLPLVDHDAARERVLAAHKGRRGA